MHCLFWNICGLGKGEKISIIKSLVRKNKISFLGLVETKHRRSSKRKIKRMWGSDDYHFCEVKASDTFSGGIIAVWDEEIFCVSNTRLGDRWILLEGCIKNTDFQCCVGVVYCPNERVGRYALFEELKNTILPINKPTLLLGDFNVVLHANERVGSYRCDLSSREFLEWIQTMGFIDIPLHGIQYTWRRNELKSRLDRGLCCNVWLREFPNMFLKGLPKSVSDHNPLLISLQADENWGPKPFRCYDAWFFHPDFRNLLRTGWGNLPNVSLNVKMKALKSTIIAWSKESFGQMDNKIEALEKAIHDLEKLSDERGLRDFEQARLSAAQNHFQLWLLRRERFWRQKAHAYGISIKDHNTKFFYASTIFRRKKKEIRHIKINDRIFHGVSSLKTEIRDYFAQRFSQELTSDFDFDMGHHNRLSEEQSRFLETIPSRQEIKNAVWACGIDKAPGFDGYNFKFIREMWDLIEQEIMILCSNSSTLGARLEALILHGWP